MNEPTQKLLVIPAFIHIPAEQGPFDASSLTDGFRMLDMEFTIDESQPARITEETIHSKEEFEALPKSLS
jgi:hypothetical protein